MQTASICNILGHLRQYQIKLLKLRFVGQFMLGKSDHAHWWWAPVMSTIP